MPKFLKITSGIFIILILVILYYFFTYKAPEQKNITWGVDFSQMQAESLKLDWKRTYLAILEDLGVKNIKLHTQWDWVEGKKDTFYFSDIDWQLAGAQRHGVKLIYVVGMKTGRWPECHVPFWAASLTKQEQQDNLLKYIKEVVLRYKNNNSIIAWQAENEPLFNFGQCPWHDKNFLAREVQVIKSLDPSRPVIISDSGDQSWWFGAAKISDIVGIAMYREAWVHVSDNYGFYAKYIWPPSAYWLKAQLIHTLFDKKVIVVEFQMEPWGPKLFYDLPLSEQEKSMNLAKFKDNIQFAKKTGFDTFYLWGVEWWYWLKEAQHKSEIWNEAINLFK